MRRLSLLAAVAIVAGVGIMPAPAVAPASPASLREAINRTLAVTSCEIEISNSMSGPVGIAIYNAPNRWLGPNSAHNAGGLVVGDLEYAAIGSSSDLLLLSPGPISHLSASGGLTPAELTAFGALLSARSASEFKAVSGGWTFGRSTAHPSITGGSIYLSTGRIKRVDIDEVGDRGKVVRQELSFSEFGTAPRIRVPAGL